MFYVKCALCFCFLLVGRFFLYFMLCFCFFFFLVGIFCPHLCVYIVFIAAVWASSSLAQLLVLLVTLLPVVH